MSHSVRFNSVIAALLLAAPLAAQGTPQSVSPVLPVVASQAPAMFDTTAGSTVARVQSAAPIVLSASVGAHITPLQSANSPSLMPDDMDRSSAMMIVGGVALIAGAVVGGTPGSVIMIGGGGLALLGLWHYLR